MEKAPMDKLPTLRFESNEAGKLADLVGIAQDLAFVEEATKRLSKLMRENSEDSVLIRSLWSSALVAYIRCFTSGKRFGLNNDIFSTIDGGEATHQYFKDVRDKHIAHSINPFEEVQIGLVLSLDGCISGVAMLSAFRLIDDMHNVEQLGRLAKYACQIIERQGKELEAEVLEQGKALNETEIKKLPQIKIQPQGGTVVAGEPRLK
jgi:hypothetical protein